MGFFDLPVPKSEETTLIFDLRGRKNEEPSHRSFPFSTRRSKNPPHVLLHPTPPLDKWPPAPLSYPEIWILSPNFYLADRSEIEIGPPLSLAAGHEGRLSPG